MVLLDMAAKRSKKNNSHSHANAIPILISGTIGTGKSTLGKHLAKNMRRKYVSASHIHRTILMRTMKKKTAMKIEDGYWESEMGTKSQKLREQNNAIDREVDAELMRFLRAHPHSVTDARLAPWMYRGKALRIWIQVSDEEAARRVAGRDHSSCGKTLPLIQKRFRGDQKLWKKMYGIDYGNDLTPFDLVINTEGFEATDTYRVIGEFIRTKLAAAKKEDA